MSPKWGVIRMIEQAVQSVHMPLRDEVIRHGRQPWSNSCLCGYRFFDKPTQLELAEHVGRVLDGRFAVTVKPTVS